VPGRTGVIGTPIAINGVAISRKVGISPSKNNRRFSPACQAL
jgi:hypothetical protein